MAETLIFEEHRIGLVYDESFYCYVCSLIPPPFSLTIGDKYRVIWDGQSYDVEGFDCSSVAGEVGVGNGENFTLGGNGEPFAIVYTSNSDVTFIALTDTEPTTHTIAVYHVTEDIGDDTEDTPVEEPEEPVVQEGIVLKDRNGNDVAYYGIETVTFDTTTEGKQQVYSKGVVVPEMEVPVTFADGNMLIEADADHLIKKIVLQKPDTLVPENIRAGVNVAAVTGKFIGDTEEVTIGESEGSTPLDFSGDNDNMEVTPSAEGKVISKVIIEKPEALIPENIAEGVDVAGIIGTFAGGGANVVYSSGTFTVIATGDVSINHNLGVVPDIIIIYTTGYTAVTTADVLRFFIGFSTAFAQAIDKTLISFTLQNRFSTTYGGYKAFRETVDATTGTSFGQVYIDSTNGGFSGSVHGANSETFVLSNTSGSKSYVDTTLTYNWIAIGGLT